MGSALLGNQRPKAQFQEREDFAPRTFSGVWKFQKRNWRSRRSMNMLD
jgi:hypothetical protein